MLGSTTLTPWSRFSSVLDRISRLKRISCPASSSTATTSATSMPEPFSARVSTSRALDDPIAAASNRSVNCTHGRSAAACGSNAWSRASACSRKARRAGLSPTMRPASASRSPTCTPLCETPDTRVCRVA
jgi:hypothetical protein